MPTYVYETLDEPVERYELYQSIKDAAYLHHPENGRPIRRVITGGLEMPRPASDPKPVIQARHSDSCACCNPRPRR